MIMKKRRVRDQAAENLAQARELSHLGSNILVAERLALKTIDRMAASLMKGPTAQDMFLFGEGSLLLGRQLRIRNRREALPWLQQAADIFGGLARSSSASPLAAARLSESLNHITLVRILQEHKGTGSRSATDRAMTLQRRAFLAFPGQVDADDARMEVMQRESEILSFRYGEYAAIEHITRTGFTEVSERRPNHNRALRYLHYGGLLAESGRYDIAWRFMESAEQIEGLEGSQFISLTILEKKARLLSLTGDEEYAHLCTQGARRIRMMEQIIV